MPSLAVVKGVYTDFGVRTLVWVLFSAHMQDWAAGQTVNLGFSQGLLYCFPQMGFSSGGGYA